MKFPKWWMYGIGMLIVSMLVITGCSTPQSCIVATNNTGIGIVVSYNPQSQMPDGKLGYVNSAFTIVPTNRAWSKDVPASGDGANDTGNVLLETSFTNWFCFWKSQNIYQRVAVGNIAVVQPGAVALMAKNNDGTINVDAVKALAGMPTYNKATLVAKSDLINKYVKMTPEQKAQVIDALNKINISWDKFIDDINADLAPVKTIIDGVK